MRFLLSCHLSVFIKEEEDFEKIKQKFLELMPFDLEEEKIALQKQTAEGFEHKKIIILKSDIFKQKHINMFLKTMLNRLTKEQKELLLRQKKSRLDNDLNFFIRFDKKRLLDQNELFITDSGECFHIKLKIAAYPAKQSTALEIIEKIFK